MAGSFVPQAELRQLFWMLDGVGIIVASALLAVKFFRKGNDTLAASFLVFLAALLVMKPMPPEMSQVSVPACTCSAGIWANEVPAVRIEAVTAPKMISFRMKMSPWCLSCAAVSLAA